VRRVKARASNTWTAFGIIGVGAALVAAVVLRFVVSSDLWLDEALSANIAKLPLGDLREALKRDGAPPLYYVILHFWIDVFGDSDTAVRALSGVLSIATLPAMYFAGRRIGGRFTGWAAVLVFATLPFSFRYATETRMYALVMFIVAWGYLAFMRALEQPKLGRLALVTAVVAALLYSHNWSFYLVAVAGLAVAWRAWRGRTPDERGAAVRVLIAMVVGGLCFLPWVPTLLYQLDHTGTPWGDARLPWSAFAATIGALGGVGKPAHGEAYVLSGLLLLLPVLALFGASVDARHVDLDLRTRPTVRWESIVGWGTIVVGLVLSYLVGTAFDPRYAAVAVPFLALVMAAGTAVFANVPVRAGVLAAVVVLGLAGGVRNSIDDRTQAGEVAAIINPRAERGDVVLYCPDQLGPSVHRLVRNDDLEEVTFPELAAPEFVDWVDYRERIRSTDPAGVARRVLDRAGDATIWYVVSPGYRSVEGKCEALGAALAAERSDPVQLVTPDDVTFFEFMGLTEFAP
jgi:mannosyltransferase